MAKFIYNITGQLTYNNADTEDGFATVEIDKTVEIDEMDPTAALAKFLEENEEYEFYGSLKTCDAETHGKRGATFRDQSEDHTIEVELTDNKPTIEEIHNNFTNGNMIDAVNLVHEYAPGDFFYEYAMFLHNTCSDVEGAYHKLELAIRIFLSKSDCKMKG